MQSSSESKRRDLGALEELFNDPGVIERVRAVSPTSFDAVAQFWRAPFVARHLSPRMKELILLAMHASASALNREQIERHVDRALAAGASNEDMVDVLVSIIGLANHALYFSVPILEEEMKAAGREEASLRPADAKFEAARQDFIAIRGFWNSDRDALARLIPEYFTALTNLSVESWKRGSLTRKEREFICIGIDCAVTHQYGPGLRIHIRNALKCGATREELLEIFQLAALMGVESYVMGVEAMFGER
jgi:alkylhydroperoxidase/carboxymuconolactone decarboxylase family protein YurZ